MVKNPEQSPLGQQSEYSEEYNPELLCPIERIPLWRERGFEEIPFQGVDIWNAYELSWLNPSGKPLVAMAEITVPADSPNIIESKSLKLYLNSLNQTKFQTKNRLRKTLTGDLSDCAGKNVEVKLFEVSDSEFSTESLPGVCLDDLDVATDIYTPDANFLKLDDEEVREKILYSHLLKTNCPVTGQPDWGSIFISYSGQQINQPGLLQYIISYRKHNDFHEQCVENIFLDIMQQCRPTTLTVFARYVRRGGLDINPYRTTTDELATNNRLIRQ